MKLFLLLALFGMVMFAHCEGSIFLFLQPYNDLEIIQYVSAIWFWHLLRLNINIRIILRIITEEAAGEEAAGEEAAGEDDGCEDDDWLDAD